MPHSEFNSAQILQQIQDHLSIVDRDFIYREVNDAYLRAHQLQREQIVGKHVADLLGRDLFEHCVRPNFERCLSGEPVHYCAEFQFRGYAEPVYMDVRYSPQYDERGEVEAVVVAAHDITELHRQQQALLRQAYTDELTGLANRSLVKLELDKHMAEAERYRRQFALIFLDLNGFKAINDHFGHVEGDRLLQQVAERLSNTCRREECPARFGGDEFVILTATGEKVESLEALSARIGQIVDTPFELSSGQVVQLGLSIGVAVYPDDGRDSEQLLSAADRRMYRHKRRADK